jgi:hypothetical protein
MTRRQWLLPYAAWALVVGAVVLVTRSGFGYCTELHPRLCANALLAGLSGAWDPEGAAAVLVLLAIGWTVIAAWRVLGRNTAIALAAWTVVVSTGMFFYGGHVQMCLGPLNVTPESCRIALGLPPETEWDRVANGPAPVVAMLLAGWFAIAMAVAWRRRQRGGL